MTTCVRCKTDFQPRRPTARFCGDRCRVANARHRVGSRTRQESAGAIVSVTGRSPSGPATKPAPATLVTLPGPVPRGSKPLHPRIVPDDKWLGMYRIRRLDDSLSTMANLTRCKDALLGG
jgi:hypothetical protein